MEYIKLSKNQVKTDNEEQMLQRVAQAAEVFIRSAPRNEYIS